MYFVYYLLDPTSGVRRWVGVTSDPDMRLAAHIHQSRKRHSSTASPLLNEWIKSLKAPPLLDTCCIVEDRQEAERIEAHLIKTLRASGTPLLNRSLGYGRTGVPITPAASQAQSDRNKKLWADPEHRTRRIAAVTAGRRAAIMPKRPGATRVPSTLVGRLIRKLTEREEEVKKHLPLL